MIEKFDILTSTAVPLNIENIDTDQIIPARFLKATHKEGFGKHLFHDWRYTAEDQPKSDFVLNSSRYRGHLLLAGKNFGCGSSREHAAWAIRGAGFKAVISSYFADIFRNNALNNGLLPVQVSAAFLKELFRTVQQNPAALITIDLSRQTIRIEENHLAEFFEIDSYKKECLLQGFDDIDYLLSIREQIENYENQRKHTVTT